MLQFSDTRGDICVALLQVQREIQPVVKDRNNPLLKNRYATLDAITDYVRPICARANCVLMQSEHMMVLNAVTQIGIETMLLHHTGEWVKNVVFVPVGDGNKGTSPQQAAGSALTYGRRYGLSALLALTTDEDDDGNGGTKQRRDAKKSGRTIVEKVNEVKATTVAQIPFPAVRGFEQHRDKPLGDVPTDALETCYQRAVNRPEKKAKMIAEAIGEILENRRQFAQPLPPEEGSVGG